jgi:hypothetical protein
MACPSDSGVATDPSLPCAGIAIRYSHMVRAGGNGGLLRCLRCEDGGVTGIQIVQPHAISATALYEVEGQPPHVLTDRWAVVAGDNPGVVIVGPGTARDIPGQRDVPLVVSSGSSGARVLDECTIRVPTATRAQRGELQIRTGQFTTMALYDSEGGLSIERLPSSGGYKDVLVYFSGDEAPGWRLANNLPTLSTSERELRTGAWRQGDMIVNSEVPAVQLLYDGVWRTLFPLS